MNEDRDITPRRLVSAGGDLGGSARHTTQPALRQAPAEYLAAHDAEQVTTALDALYADQPSELDESVAAAQAVAVAVEDW